MAASGPPDSVGDMNPRLVGREIARVAADQDQAVDLGRSPDQQVGQAQAAGPAKFDGSLGNGRVDFDDGESRQPGAQRVGLLRTFSASKLSDDDKYYLMVRLPSMSQGTLGFMSCILQSSQAKASLQGTIHATSQSRATS